MNTLANIFLNNILPAFLVMGAGVLLDRTLGVDKHSLSRLAIYVLTPCLVFSSIVQSSIDPGQFGAIILFVFVVTAAMMGIALLVGKVLRWPARRIDALVLSAAFFNAGNFGLSVILFTFGEAGLELGTVFFVASNLCGNTLAIFFASRGQNGSRQALLAVFKLPGLYAFALALLFRLLGWSLPAPLSKPITLIGGGSVPIMLMLLGVQLSQTRVAGRFGQVSIGVGLRLVVGALVGLALAPLLGLQGLARSVVVAEAAMPSAVSSALVAIQFDADAEYVTSVVFFSTLLSAASLTVLLTVLG